MSDLIRQCLDCRQHILAGAVAFWWNNSRGPLCWQCQDKPSNRGRLVQPKVSYAGQIVPLMKEVEYV